MEEAASRPWTEQCQRNVPPKLSLVAQGTYRRLLVPWKAVELLISVPAVLACWRRSVLRPCVGACGAGTQQTRALVRCHQSLFVVRRRRERVRIVRQRASAHSVRHFCCLPATVLWPQVELRVVTRRCSSSPKLTVPQGGRFWRLWVKLTTRVTVKRQSRCGSVLGCEHEVRSSL